MPFLKPITNWYNYYVLIDLSISLPKLNCLHPQPAHVRTAGRPATVYTWVAGEYLRVPLNAFLKCTTTERVALLSHYL